MLAACAPPAAPLATPEPATKTERPRRAQTATKAVSPKSEVVLDNLVLPAALAFAPDGRLFFVEVNAGRIRIARGKDLQPEPVASVPVQQAAESGLLGLALDPEFDRNHFVYAYYSEGDPASPARGIRNRVVRFTERDGIGGEMTPILDNLPSSASGAEDAHQGGALVFGPDGKLYVSVGETGNPAAAQELSSLAGKILRINPDGSLPADNPFPGSPIFAIGFRNSWGMAFHPKTGDLFATENGNKAHDEVNLVKPGGNYGWPKLDGINDDPKYVDPIWDSGHGKDARNGMVGISIYAGAMFPELEDQVLFCSFNSGKMRRIALDPPRFNRFSGIEDLAKGCRLGVTVGPDGAIYFSSVNQILRLVR